MAPRIELFYAEMLAELNAASRPVVGEDPPGFWIVRELCKETGVCEREVRNRIAVAEKAGRVERAKVWRQGSDGRLIRVTAYKILKATK